MNDKEGTSCRWRGGEHRKRFKVVKAKRFRLKRVFYFYKLPAAQTQSRRNMLRVKFPLGQRSSCDFVAPLKLNGTKPGSAAGCVLVALKMRKNCLTEALAALKLHASYYQEVFWF